MAAESNDVTIRAVGPAHLDAVTAIYAQDVLHGTGTFELVPPTVAEMADRVAAVTDAQLPYLVAVEGGEVLGFAYAGAYRPRPAYRFTVEDSIYLRPAATGRGVGTRLLAEVVQACEALGLRQIIAVIGDSANAGSIRTHAKCGFELAGTFRAVGWKHARWLDTVLMQRSLGEGATTTAE
jgi:L-amino acid N-acyltransferase YncA